MPADRDRFEAIVKNLLKHAPATRSEQRTVTRKSSTTTIPATIA
jgi:hypothetical protein